MIELIPFIVLPLAIARLTLIIVRDDVTLHLRRLLWAYSPSDQPHVAYWKATKDEKIRGLTVGRKFPLNRYIEVEQDGNSPGFWGQVISCPDCCGVWVAAFVLATFLLWPEPVLLGSYVLAASMITSLIARKY